MTIYIDNTPGINKQSFTIALIDDWYYDSAFAKIDKFDHNDSITNMKNKVTI